MLVELICKMITCFGISARFCLVLFYYCDARTIYHEYHIYPAILLLSIPLSNCYDNAQTENSKSLPFGSIVDNYLMAHCDCLFVALLFIIHF